jgi:hypothetical protein
MRMQTSDAMIDQCRYFSIDSGRKFKKRSTNISSEFRAKLGRDKNGPIRKEK